MRGKVGMMGESLLQPWLIETSRFVGSLDVSSQDQFPNGIAFSDNGTEMYVVGVAGDRVSQYTLETPWEVASASYTSSFYVGSNESVPRAIAFKPDGSRLFVAGSLNDRIMQYSLAVPWDITTAGFDSDLYVGLKESVPSGMFFRSDGMKLYLVGVLQPATVNEYTMQTAWEINTAQHSDSKQISGYESYPNGIFFSGDGLRMFLAGTQNSTLYGTPDVITSLSLTTPWALAGINGSTTYGLVSPAANPHDIALKPDGTELYLVDIASSSILQYSVG